MAIDELPIAQADPELLDVCGGLASERHRAINWLMGYNSSIYSKTDTST